MLMTMSFTAGLHPDTAVLELCPAPIEDDQKKWFITQDHEHESSSPCQGPEIREAACGGCVQQDGRPDHKT